MLFLSPHCPTAGTCWDPGPPPLWIWLAFALIVGLAAAIIFLAEEGRPSWRSFFTWLGIMVVFGVSVEGLELIKEAFWVPK
jgi:hypothetical protein